MFIDFLCCQAIMINNVLGYSMQQATPSLKQTMSLFRKLNWLFWLAWAVFPLSIASEIFDILDTEAIRSLVRPEQMACLESIPSPTNLSFAGTLLFWCIYTINQLFFVAMMIVIHRAIWRFAAGRIFVGETLSCFRLLGLLIISWGFSETILNNVLAYGLFLTNDLQRFQASYALDIPALAVGLFILTFKFAIDRAIALQQDADLTI
jgi:hypothetical protein